MYLQQHQTNTKANKFQGASLVYVYVCILTFEDHKQWFL